MSPGPSFCHRDAETVSLARGMGGSDDLRAHVSRCPACAEVLRVAEELNALAAETPMRALPSMAQIWWRAQLVARLGKRTVSERPIETMQWIQIVVGMVVSLMLLVWQVPVVFEALGRVGGPSRTVQPLSDLSGPPTRWLIGTALVSLAATAMAVAFFHFTLPDSRAHRDRDEL